jgi:hypothetical protein
MSHHISNQGTGHLISHKVAHKQTNRVPSKVPQDITHRKGHAPSDLQPVGLAKKAWGWSTHDNEGIHSIKRKPEIRQKGLPPLRNWLSTYSWFLSQLLFVQFSNFCQLPHQQRLAEIAASCICSYISEELFPLVHCRCYWGWSPKYSSSQFADGKSV